MSNLIFPYNEKDGFHIILCNQMIKIRKMQVLPNVDHIPLCFNFIIDDQSIPLPTCRFTTNICDIHIGVTITPLKNPAVGMLNPDS